MSKKKSSYYAVRKGHTAGVYLSWEDASKQVTGYPGAEFKKFDSLEDAVLFLEAPNLDFAKQVTENPKQEVTPKSEGKTVDLPEGPYAFVDGSFNIHTGVYGYGGFLVADGQAYPLSGSGKDPDMAGMRNVSGEIEGSMAAVRKAKELGISDMTLFYDYKGIEEWVTGKWQANREGTKAYRDFMREALRDMNLHFRKVPAHTGIEGNEMADVMAKHAVGIDLTRKERALFEEVPGRASRRTVDISVQDAEEDGYSYD